jgi:hypothetical protein
MRKFYTLFLLGLISLQAFAQDEIPVYCLDNDKVAAYFSRPEYNPNDYSYTYIRDYCYDLPWNWKNYGTGERLDQPLPAKVILQNALSAEGTLYVSENADYSDALVLSVAQGLSSIDVYNLIPNRTYNWKVIDKTSSAIVESGQFQTTGHVRMLKIDGIFNVRDMGGWIGLGGNPIKYGKLIRGSRLNVNGSPELLITQEGIDELRRLGIRAELDMRDPGDAVNATHSFLGEDIPIRNVQGAYGSRIATFADKPQSIQGIKQIISWFKEDRPVYFHCSVGADRTGTVAYLIGALCGMSEDALCREFELTSFSGDSVTNSRDTPNPEVLIRQRTYVGRVDPNDDNDSYKFASMVDKIKTFPGGTLQRKVYNHLLQGVNGYSISADDLSFLVKYLTGYSILGRVDTDVDTLRLETGQTHKIIVTPFPADAEFTTVSFKSTCPDIATVDADGTVTAVGGGSAYIIADVDGLQKLIPVIVPITAENIKVYSLYNEAMAQYMNESPYSDDDYSVSYIDKYVNMSVSSARRDWSKPVTISWEPYEGIESQTLYRSDTVTFANSTVVTLSKTESSYTFEKLDPGKVYYYKINIKLSSGETMVLFSSAFQLSDVVKVINCDFLFNLRDLGGWTGLNGKKVKYGQLYRGSRIRHNLQQSPTGQVDTEAARFLKDLGIRAELDLRTLEENSSSNAAIDRRGSKLYKVPNAKDCLGSNILNGEAYVRGLKQIIDWLQAGRKIYISASLGAERTGAMAFLINGLLGVNEDCLARDYELSSFSADSLVKGQIWKRNEGNYPAMVSAIKTLEGTTLQEKIYNYFKTGFIVDNELVAVTTTNLDWFIDYMLEEDKSPFTDVEPVTVDNFNVIKRNSNGKIFNMFGFEADITEPGLYIIDGKTVYVTE